MVSNINRYFSYHTIYGRRLLYQKSEEASRQQLQERLNGEHRYRRRHYGVDLEVF
jgi:hypothetical protein